MINKAQRQPKRVVFPEGEEDKILRACQILLDEKIASPILLGDEERIRARMAELHLHLERRPDHGPGEISAAGGLRRGALPAAPAQGHDPHGGRSS